MNYKVVIAGGGITGLTAAYRLKHLAKKTNLDLEITLIEATERLGGVIKSESVEDYVIEHGPDAFLADRPEMQKLLADLDLSQNLLPTTKNNRRAFVARSGNLVPLPTGFYLISPTNLLSLFKSTLFSISGKLRIALEALLSFSFKANKQQDESAASFIVRHFGQELLARAGEPLIGSIYMADVNLLSARSTLPYFIKLESTYGSIIQGLAKTKYKDASTASGARYNLFGSFASGMDTLIERLAKQISHVQILLNTKIEKLSLIEQTKWLIDIADGQKIEADVVILAMPAKLVAPVVRDLNKNLADSLSEIETISSVVVNLLYKKENIGHKLDGFGFVVPFSENQKFIASGWISKKFSDRAPLGYEVIRVFLGGARQSYLCNLDKDELIELAHSQLTSYLRITDLPEKAWLSKWFNGLPYYKVGHSQIVETIESHINTHPGLYLAGASYNGLGIPDCVRSAENTTCKLIDFLQAKDQTPKGNTVGTSRRHFNSSP